MKIKPIKLSALLLLFALIMNSCTVTSDDGSDPDASSANISAIESSVFIYDELVIRGSGLNVSCGNNKVTLANDDNTISLEIRECTETEITAWIPEDAVPGVYSVTADIENTAFTSINGTAMEVEIKTRPVITSMSKTSFNDGETITIEGLNLQNTSSLPQHNPIAWIMASGYSNNVSDVEVNSDGTGATIIIDDGIEAGEYNFVWTTDEWSNEVVITIL